MEQEVKMSLELENQIQVVRPLFMLMNSQRKKEQNQAIPIKTITIQTITTIIIIMEIMIETTITKEIKDQCHLQQKECKKEKKFK